MSLSRSRERCPCLLSCLPTDHTLTISPDKGLRESCKYQHCVSKAYNMPVFGRENRAVGLEALIVF